MEKSGSLNFLLIDIGTTSLKAGILNGDGKVLKFFKLSYNVYDINSIKDTLKKLFLQLKISTENLSGISVSGNGPTLIPLSKNFTQTEKTILWLNRSEKKSNIDSFFLPNISNFKNQNFDSYKNTYKFLTPADYIVYLLSGEVTTSIFNFNFKKYYWDDEQIEKLNLDRKKFSDFSYFSKQIGVVSKNGGRDFGLQNIPIYASCIDYIVALLGSGCFSKRTLFNRTGTGESITAITTDNIKNSLPFYKNYRSYSKFSMMSGMVFDEIFNQDQFKQFTMEENIKNILSENYKNYSDKNLSIKAKDILAEITFSYTQKINEFKDEGFKFDKVVISGGQSCCSDWLHYKEKISGVKIVRLNNYVAELSGSLQGILSSKYNLELENININKILY